MSVKLSIGTPVVAMHPATGSPWEASASIEELARIAQAADRLGYHHISCAEHIAVPTAATAIRGARYWDPLATFGYLAAITRDIRFATGVLVLPYHHPLDIAKRYGTLDKVSHGRVILGVGVGTLKEEFDLIGAPYDHRGERSDDALRAALSRPEPEYHGEYYDFEGFVIDPCAVQDTVPLWVGGRTLRSLRRAATLADGWCPFATSPRQAAEWLQRVETRPGFDIILPPTARLDPVSQPGRAQEILAETEAHGATIISCTFKSHTLTEYLDALEALAAVHAAMATR
jgi:probable F420-dependent oxidoreductase